MAAVPGIYFPLRRNARGKAHESLFLPKGGGCGGGVRLFAIAARRAVAAAAAVVGCCCCGAVGFLLCPSGGWSVLHIRVPNLKARADRGRRGRSCTLSRPSLSDGSEYSKLSN